MSISSYLFVFSLLFLTACGQADLAGVAAATSNYDTAKVQVFYWDNKNLGFGHIALNIDAATPVYLSYAMGNDLATDLQKHGKEPEVLLLPPRSSEELSSFNDWYEQSPYSDSARDTYGQDYHLLKHNCAHAVVNALRKLEYHVPINGTPLALRPSQVYRAASKIQR